MGSNAIHTLYQLVKGEPISTTEDIIGTNVLTHVLVPLELPQLTVDQNLLHTLEAVGYVLFGLIAVVAIGSATWTYRSRNVQLVQVSQPWFLFAVAAGILIMSAALIPLSMDDDGQPHNQSEQEGTLVCMSIPWLGFCGFTITFIALYSKLKRITRIFNSNGGLQRTTVGYKGALINFTLLLSANILILSLWTALDPLTYIRLDHPGTDGWNRNISNYGSCRCDQPAWYLVPLGIINLSVLLIANWQAYQARFIKSELSESRYIGVAMISLLQSIVIGVPVLFVVKDWPQAFYLVLCFTIFIVCMIVLLVIFTPKMVLARQSADDQRQRIRRCIRHSIKREGGSPVRKPRNGSTSSFAYDGSALFQNSWDAENFGAIKEEQSSPVRLRFADIESSRGVPSQIAMQMPSLESSGEKSSQRRHELISSLQSEAAISWPSTPTAVSASSAPEQLARACSKRCLDEACRRRKSF